MCKVPTPEDRVSNRMRREDTDMRCYDVEIHSGAHDDENVAVSATYYLSFVIDI